MTDPIKRMNFFDGQFLRAPEFQLVQDYHLELLRDHMRLLHTPGIAPGTLDVPKPPQGSTTVTVNPGIAFDSAGRRMVLTEPRLIELAGVLPVDKPVFITISYREAPSDPTDETGIQGYTRLNEDPVIEPSITAPTNPEDNLVLGVVSRDAGGHVTGIDGSTRRTPGLKSGDLDVTGVRFSSASVDPTGWVAADLGTSGRLDVHGNLRVTGNLILGGGIQPDTNPAPPNPQLLAAFSSFLTGLDFARVGLGDDNVPPDGWVNLTLGAPGKANLGGSLQVAHDLVVGGRIIANIDPVAPAAVSSGSLTGLDFDRVGLGSDNVPPEGWVNLTLLAPRQAQVGGSLKVTQDLVVDGTIKGDIAVGTVQAGDLADNAVATTAIADGAVTRAKLAGNSVDGTKIIDGSVSTNKIADSAVTGAKLAANSVDATKIIDGSVGTNKIADSAVTGAKLAANSVDATKIIDGSVGTNKIADSAVSGPKLAVNSVDSTRIIDGSIGTNKIADSAVSGPKLAVNSVDSTRIIDGSVGTNKIADSAVTLAKLAGNSIDGTKIIDGSVGTNEIADSAVTLAKLAGNSVDGTKIVDGSVGSNELAAGAVTAGKLANGSVTTAKLASDVQQSINVGVQHAAVTGNPHGTTAADVGALPTGGGILTGSLTIADGSLHINNAFLQAAFGTSEYSLFLQGQGGVGPDRPNWISGPTTFGSYVSFQGGKGGYVVDRFINGGKSVLRPGDVVSLRGTPVARYEGDLNRLPVSEVVLADKEEDSAVIGIVHLQAAPGPEMRAPHVRLEDPTVIPESAELYVVTLGAFAHCKVDASEVPIKVGDLLTTSSKPGFAKKATAPKFGSIIGKALEPLSEGTGYISVFVNVQ